MAVTVGLDIGTVAVRAAVVDAAKGKHVLRRFAEMPLPPGAVSGGEIVDEDAVSEAVAALWKRAKLPKRRVVLGSANQRIVVRQVDVPQMEESELAEALPFQVQDSIPIAVDDAILDFVPLESFTTPDGEPMLSILVVAVHRDTVEKLVRVADAGGISLQAIDLQAFGLVRAVFGTGGGGPDDPAQVLVDIGGSVSQVVIARGGTPRFVRMLPRGGDDFTDALVSELAIDIDDAEELKRRVGVAPEGPASETAEEERARIVMTRLADSLIDEIRGSINFFLGQGEDQSVSRLVVSGNAARLPHLANRLGRALAIPVEPARVLSRIEIGRVQLSEAEMQAAQPVLPTSVGLALWGAE